MSETSIRQCSCGNAYQDAKYGPGRRVFDRGKDHWGCTSCGREESAPSAEAKDKGKTR